MQINRDIIALMELRGIGRKTAMSIAKSLKQPADTSRDLYQATEEALSKTSRQAPISPNDVAIAFDEANQAIEKAYSLGLSILGFLDCDYPKRLLSIKDPPILLYIKGSVKALIQEFSVAIIGTRHPTNWGCKAAERLGQRFAERNCTVVSGLALGCDAAAHEGCLLGHGTTVAVLAHGLDSVYPAKHRELADRIIQTGGSLVSEYAPGQRAHRAFFIERDRIQSALSWGVFVAETDITGGTMHTVKACLEQGRLLACLVHPEKYANVEQARGNQQLIREGKAFPVATDEDLKNFFGKLESKSSAGSTHLRPNACVQEKNSDSAQLGFLELSEEHGRNS